MDKIDFKKWATGNILYNPRDGTIELVIVGLDTGAHLLLTDEGYAPPYVLLQDGECSYSKRKIAAPVQADIVYEYLGDINGN